MTNDNPKWQRWKNIMKCYPFEEKRLSKWTHPFIVQPKYDGVRCRAVPQLVSDAKGRRQYLLVSSEENLINSVPHIDEALNRLGTRIELDGELYCHGKSFEEIVSITSRTVNLHPNHLEIEFHLFDIIVENMTCLKRILMLENLRNLMPFIKVSPFYLCETLDEITKVYDNLLEQGYEGIIVRHCDAPYERKRSTWIMKFKPKQEDNYEIVGVEEEISIEGVSKDRLGALVCKSGNGNVFDVGTGFTEDQRIGLWDLRGILPGMTAKVKYQHITSGRKVPRFPVFVEIVQ